MLISETRTGISTSKGLLDLATAKKGREKGTCSYVDYAKLLHARWIQIAKMSLGCDMANEFAGCVNSI